VFSASAFLRRSGLALWAVAALVLAGTRAAPRVAAAEKPAGSAEAVAAAQQKLVGAWKLNAERSEDPRAKMREAGGGRVPGGMPGGPGGGGPGGMPGGPGGGKPGSPGGGGWGGGTGARGVPPTSGAPQSGGRLGDASFTRPIAFGEELTVTNLTPEITMVDPEGEIRRLHADNKGYKDSSGLEVKTRWEGARLVVETKTGRGLVKETWSVDDDPRRLTVLVRMDNPSGGAAVSVRRVFDPAVTAAEREER